MNITISTVNNYTNHAPVKSEIRKLVGPSTRCISIPIPEPATKYRELVAGERIQVGDVYRTSVTSCRWEPCGINCGVPVNLYTAAYFRRPLKPEPVTLQYESLIPLMSGVFRIGMHEHHFGYLSFPIPEPVIADPNDLLRKIADPNDLLRKIADYWNAGNFSRGSLMTEVNEYLNKTSA